MSLANLVPQHKTEFETMATVWLQLGASSVELLENGSVIASYPVGKTDLTPAMIANDKVTGLELHIHNFMRSGWQPSADLQIQMFGQVLNADQEMDALTSSLVETQDRLVALYDLSRATRRAIEVDDLLNLLTVESSRLLDADGAFAVVYLPGQPPIVRQSAANPLPESQLLAAAALYRLDPNKRTFKDSQTLPTGLRNVVMSYMPVRDKVFACLGVFNKDGNFTAPDSKLLKAITDQAGANLDNALLYQDAILRVRQDTEMDLARQVQTSLMPQSLPKLKGVDIYGVSIPALQVGGDFFDVVAMPNRPLVFLMGDVTGKGMPAALLMSMTHTVARSAIRYMPFKAPNQILERLNKDLLDDYSTVGMFTTAFVGVLEETNQRLLYSNAGQSPIIFIPQKGEPLLLEADDIPVGIFDGHIYKSQTLEISIGDVLVAMTDGFNETRDQTGELFGIERLKSELVKLVHLSAQEIATGLIQAVSDYAGDHPQDDDRTLVVLKVTS